MVAKQSWEDEISCEAKLEEEDKTPPRDGGWMVVGALHIAQTTDVVLVESRE